MTSSTLSSRRRGRPRQFDADLALESAMGAFWSGGYSGTSLPELEAATRLSRSSIYAAFGDKDGLFVQALERYIERGLKRLDAELAGGRPALDGIRTFLRGYVERSWPSGSQRGCLVIATTMDRAAQNPAVAQSLRRSFRTMEARLTQAVARAQAEGDLDGACPAPALARLLLALAEGLRVVDTAGMDAGTSFAAVDALIARFSS